VEWIEKKVQNNKKNEWGEIEKKVGYKEGIKQGNKQKI
jgi:hypothetical protein